jgi:O-6-methylguanine DNA methyltransferase
MILEYGKVRGLPGVVCVIRESGAASAACKAGKSNKCGRIVAIIPFLCKEFDTIMPSFAKDYVQKVMGFKVQKVIKADMGYLAQHLKGKKKFKFSEISPDCVTDFREAVYRELFSTKPGTVVTYGQLAAKAGNKGAARAVGSAMSSNPLPLIIPCHRVKSSTGKENFSMPCLKKRPANCCASKVMPGKKALDCSREIKSMLREFEVNG